MPTCPVKNCHLKHLKKTGNGKKVTFHRLPKNQKRREEWITSLELDEKRVTNNTLICSQHFSEEQFDHTSLSCIRLRENAVPKIVESIKITERKRHLSSEDNNISDIPSKRSVITSCNANYEEDTNREEFNLQICDAEIQTTEVSVQRENLCNKETSVSPSKVMNSPTKRYLRQALVQQRKQYRSKIKMLQQNARRNKKRIAHLQSVIQKLRSNRFLDEEQLDILNGIGTCYTELLKRKVAKGKKKSISTRYTPKLRSFALTLHSVHIIRAIVSKYLKVRIGFICSNQIARSQSIRNMYTKLVHFKSQ